jgi:methionyl aminopeptidase
MLFVEQEEKKMKENGEEEEHEGFCGDDDEEGEQGATSVTKKKKKKKKKSKKSTDASDQIVIKLPCQKPMALGLKPTAFTDYYVAYGQTEPPTIPVAELFAKKELPHGEIQKHFMESQSYRETDRECRARDRLQEDLYNKVRQGAEVHRQVRAYAQSFIKPGIELVDMCTRLENKNRELVGEAGLDRGIAFPTGCSLNHVAAHYSPNTGDTTKLSYDDVMKVDFGVQIDGRIVDCAWTVYFNEKYDPLVNAVREATETGMSVSCDCERL